MSEEELLENAARAADMRTFGFDALGNILIDPVVYSPWNPLTRTSDALQLAREMDMNIHYGEKVILISEPAGACSQVVEVDCSDLELLTRKAITHLAAHVGKNM
ncbi:hypothetical protein HA41_00400 [Pantoea conspicua]|uniref:Uncharacterized protein n=1 Tax=Pantoea conspicua TaxID=472705 RepID=A0A1X1C2P1_9GAMM|nr:hypothetical protein [Pantoea conspicua]ORM55926.1 hypothetical protein HA41_00400 [Pantoea conspicua]